MYGFQNSTPEYCKRLLGRGCSHREFLCLALTFLGSRGSSFPQGTFLELTPAQGMQQGENILWIDPLRGPVFPDKPGSGAGAGARDPSRSGALQLPGSSRSRNAVPGPEPSLGALGGSAWRGREPRGLWGVGVTPGRDPPGVPQCAKQASLS